MRVADPGSNPQPGRRDGLPPIDGRHRQDGWDLQFEWGPDGLAAVGPGAKAVVVVDVLRFTTAVSVAVGRGAIVLPYPWREDGGWSLSPTDLARIAEGTRLVLPSPNGSALAFGAREAVPDATVLAGCLRNAAAVATVAAEQDGPLAVVAAGECWQGSSRPLRPAVEDLLGAGAVLRALVDVGGRPAGGASPEARAAIAAFDAARDDLGGWLADSASGRELVGIGFGDDVEAAARFDAEDAAAVLAGPAFSRVAAESAGPLR